MECIKVAVFQAANVNTISKLVEITNHPTPDFGEKLQAILFCDVTNY